jgi:hypothetical protein
MMVLGEGVEEDTSLVELVVGVELAVRDLVEMVE